QGHPHLFFVEHGLLRREHALTPWMANVSPWLPRVAGADFTHQTFPRDAVLSEFIEGDNWHEVMASLTVAENAALWRELAGLLHRVHATPAPHFGWTHPEKAHGRWEDFILEGARGLLGDFTRLGVADAEARAWMAAAETGAEVLGLITEARVLHGDPWPKNVLVRREEGRMRIVALLDHERGLFGDPWQEWVFHGCDFPPVFWEAFGARPTDPASLFRAAVYRGVIDLQCLLEAVRYDWDAAEVRPRLLAGAAEMRRLRAELRP
ncbi:MAG TPA: phosphotransferase, partial [Rariglobus sp.]